MERHEILAEFIRRHYYAELLQASREEKPSLTVDFSVLDRFSPAIVDELLENPEAVLADFEKAVRTFDIGKMPVRIRNLPERKQIRIRNLRSEHIGRLIATDAIVKSATEVKPQVEEAVFKCPECEFLISVRQEDANMLRKAAHCQNCGRRGEFPLIERKMFDTRWLKGVEPFEITTGEQPSEMAIFLRDDLTTPRMQKKTDPGNRLKIVGILKELPKRIKGRMTTRLDTYIEVNHVEPGEIEFEELEITPEDEAKIHAMASDPNIYTRLRNSIAPGIHGYETVKDAIAMQLFSGIPHVLPDGNRIRGNIHILLTGDPGVGKTMFLKLASRIVPRGRYVSGSGVTGAGLTASVRKDEILGTWVLEAGALILCNKGLISIDEFDKMSKDDQIAMHEATSVETVSIAKASIVATLPAQTSVLAGANPKLGRFDAYRSIREQIEIPETLLSRFDLKFVLKDTPDKVKDEQLAEHITISRILPEKVTPEINTNLLRKYIAYAKKNVQNLQLIPETAERLKKFYIDIRSSTPEGVIGITLRQYEALLRLAEASAKIRLDTHIRLEDAERAISLMTYSLRQLGYEEGVGFDIDKFESGISAMQRSRMRIILDIIEKLHREQPQGVQDEDIYASAQEQGVDRAKAEEILQRLIQEGMVYSPMPGFVKKP